MKRLFVLLLCATLLTPSTAAAVTGSSTTIVLRIGDPTMTVNGSPSPIDGSGTKPVIVGGRTMLPIRSIVEALGGTVTWDAMTRTVAISLARHRLELTIGKATAAVDGATVYIDSTNHSVVPIIVGGRTMLPVRFVAEQLGGSVQWVGATQTVTLTFDAVAAPPAAPVLVAPASGSSFESTTPTLTWRPVPEATSYRVTIMRGATTVLETGDLTATSLYVAQGVLVPGDYSWTVVATGSGGIGSPHDPAFTFTVLNPQPSVQTVEMHVKYSGWDPPTLHIKAGALITWIIWGDEITSCTNRILVPSLSISLPLRAGRNSVTFTAPPTAGVLPFSCWMGMVRGQFIVDP